MNAIVTPEKRLVLVTPEPQFGIFHDWLTSEKGMDRVHPISGREELMMRRLGGAGDSKRCYALVGNAGKVESVIYTHWTKATATNKPWEMLPGKIGPILDAESEPVSDPDLVTFYSISAFTNGSGRPLISAVYDEFTKDGEAPILTTLSPLRTLSEWLRSNKLKLDGNEEAKLETVARYLKLKENPVEKFHLGNGAQVGAIHFNAAARGLDLTDGAGVMISYRYPRRKDRLAENREIYNSGQIPRSYHLDAAFS